MGKDNKEGFIKNEKCLLKKEILENLYKKYRLGIVTGRPKEEAYLTLKKFGIPEFFDVVITMEDYPVGKAKPDPYPINLALQKLESDDAVYIGDNVDDIKAAISANINAIGVIPKNVAATAGIRQLLLQNGAKCVLEDVNKIIEVLE